MTENLTISGIAMNIFLHKYYDIENKPIPLVNKAKIFEDIKSSYHGGRTEVYIPRITKGYYYDVNSLYPYAALNPMPGLNSEYFECYTSNIPLTPELFGFFYCKIKTPDNYLGLLPVKTKKGLIFPIGEWEGCYFSEELKFAQENGYEITILKGYNFDRVNDVFKTYIEDIYKIKSNPANEAEKNVAKLLLNSLIGRLGMDFNKYITKTVNEKEHDFICSTRDISHTVKIIDDVYRVTFNPNVSKSVCDTFGLDYTTLLNSTNYEEGDTNKTYKTVSMPVASAVLAYARIHMGRIKLYILNNNGKIYYTDTDSIVTDIALPDEMVDPKIIGKLKLEHTIKQGYFISNKTYCIVNTEGKIIKKAKGVNSEKLTL